MLTKLSLVLPATVAGSFMFHAVVREGLYLSLEERDRTATHRALFQLFEKAALVDDIPSVSSARAVAAVEAFYHYRLFDPEGALRWWDKKCTIFHDAGFHRLVEEIDRDCIGIASVCLDEIEYAQRACKIPIVPVQVVSCEVPFLIFRLHQINFRYWRESEATYQAGLNQICAAIAEAIQRHKSPERPWTPSLSLRRSTPPNRGQLGCNL